MIPDVDEKNPIKIITDPWFRKGFCLKPGFRFEHLRPYCQELVFATDGFKTEIEDIVAQLLESFEDFNPDTDCIIPTGTGITNLMTGYLLATKFKFSHVTVAFFKGKVIDSGKVIIPESYIFYRLPLEYLLSPSSYYETTG